MKILRHVPSALLCGSLLLSGCKKDAAKETPAPAPAAAAPATAVSTEIDPLRLATFKPLPASVEAATNPITDAKVTLGKTLYFDTRLSRNHEISCNTCHNLETYGVDNQKFSPGHQKALGGRNSPSVYNVAGHIAQFWDGRAATVEEQATGPMMNPVEMAMAGPDKVEEVLRSIPGYEKLFKAAFPDDKDPVKLTNAAAAIGAFERKLLTPSRWDKFLAGDKTALTAEEKQGFNTFVDAGCLACHNGPYVGGSMYQKLGVVKPWPNDKDLGRYDVTKQDGDKYVFKVPSLRNVEKTAPYFHDGSTDKLDEAVKLMARHQLGKELNDGEVKSIVAWLKTLTGEIPASFITKPTLPESGPKTPKADPT